jgi:IS5 family transposase
VGVQGTRAGEKEGQGEGKRERERERGGELTSGSKSGDHRLQNLGHHGGDRERFLRGRNQMRERDQGGTRMGEGTGARGAPGQTELGWDAPRVKTPWHAQPQIGNQSTKQNPKQN